MLITKIKCFYCGNEGQIELVGLDQGVGPDRLFEYLGHDGAAGNMLFSCPRCKSELLVNPIELLGPGVINGMPLYREADPVYSGIVEFQSAASF
jgi:hypothetical protein